MPNPTFARLEVCEKWIENNIFRLNPIWALVKESKSYDTLIRKQKNGMPDPRLGASIEQCMEWLNSTMSYTELASQFGVSVGTVVKWVKIYGMPDPTKGSLFGKCLTWLLENHEEHGLRLSRYSTIHRLIKGQATYGNRGDYDNHGEE